MLAPNFAFLQQLKNSNKQPGGNFFAGRQFIIPMGTKLGAIGLQPSTKSGCPNPRARLVLRSRATKSGRSLSYKTRFSLANPMKWFCAMAICNNIGWNESASATNKGPLKGGNNRKYFASNLRENPVFKSRCRKGSNKLREFNFNSNLKT